MDAIRAAAVGRGAQLTDADLPCAILLGAELEGIRLSEVNLIETDLSRANHNLDKANLTGVDLFKADLEGVDLHRTTRDQSADQARAQKWLYEDYLTRGPVGFLFH